MKFQYLIPLALGIVGATWAVPSFAQQDNIRSYSRADRSKYESPQNFAFEIRFGPYRPEVDEEFGSAKPYETAFGTDRNFYFGLEFDWQAIRIPWFGSFGPGVGWGYTQKSANAKESATGSPSGDETSLSIMPMYAVGVLRIDVLARDVGIPIVGYGKAGLGLGLWSAGNGGGTANRDGMVGRGRSWGTHLALGAMLLLDAFDEASAVTMDNASGINNSYFFFEWMRNNLDGMLESKPQLHVGTNTWVLGLAMEL
jgi:hypothetical protein